MFLTIYEPPRNKRRGIMGAFALFPTASCGELTQKKSNFSIKDQ
jgi:hypothetical protein